MKKLLVEYKHTTTLADYSNGQILDSKTKDDITNSAALTGIYLVVDNKLQKVEPSKLQKFALAYSIMED